MLLTARKARFNFCANDLFYRDGSSSLSPLLFGSPSFSRDTMRILRKSNYSARCGVSGVSGVGFLASLK